MYQISEIKIENLKKEPLFRKVILFIFFAFLIGFGLWQGKQIYYSVMTLIESKRENTVLPLFVYIWLSGEIVNFVGIISRKPLLMIFLPVVYGVTLAECFITKNNYSTCVFDVTALTLWLTSLNLVYLSLFALAEWTEENQTESKN